MPDRKVVRIVPGPQPILPGLRRSGRVVSHLVLPALRCTSKADAVEMGKLICRLIVAEGGKAQLMVHDRRGRFEYEHTYPDDTPRRKS